MEPIQASEVDRIKRELEKFGSKVRTYKLEFRKRSFFKYATGADAAYPEIDLVASELLALKVECGRFGVLASIFEFPQLVEPINAVRACVHATWCFASPWLSRSAAAQLTLPRVPILARRPSKSRWMT